MKKWTDDTPSKFANYRAAVIKSVLETYIATLNEVELIVDQELDTLQDIFYASGSVEEGATMLALLQDLEDK